VRDFSAFNAIQPWRPMAVDSTISRILRLYGALCQPRSVVAVDSPASFSGAGLWRVETNMGSLCLRRWPREHPSLERLEFIQAVLWHVHQEGFGLVPLPLETEHRHGHVWHEGHLWELTPWLAGAADYRARPSPPRLRHAMHCLARFHRAAASFPLAEVGPADSPAIGERHAKLVDLLSGRLAELRNSVDRGAWPQLDRRARELLTLVEPLLPKVEPSLRAAAGLRVEIQPCIRDVWHAHVLYVGDEVSGLVDFGSMRPENVSADVARLLGSMAVDDSDAWRRGLEAYESIRPLSPAELKLVTAFDRSLVLMGGLQWLEWIYLDGREFAHPWAVLMRIDELLARLYVLSQKVA
jgi:Ser/Thr protein kinase RdoA (MazF antagonist)